MTEQVSKVLEVKKRHEAALLKIPSVVGVGIGEEVSLKGAVVPCIKVYVAESRSRLRELIPSEIEGFKVAIEVIGKIKHF